MWKDLIVADPKVMLGKPVLAGTRITVEQILDELAAGRSMEDLLSAHPRLSRDKIQAALAYAADVLRTDVEFLLEEVNR